MVVVESNYCVVISAELFIVDNIIAVSYTHLDVYKRQNLFSLQLELENNTS